MNTQKITMNREKAIRIAIEHAKKWEGFCCSQPYKSGVKNKYFSNIDLLPSNTKVWSYPDGKGYSIGYGSYSKLSDGTPVTATLSITKERAEQEMEREMRNKEAEVFKLVKVPLNEVQYAALIETAYNAGTGALSYTSNRRGETFPSLISTVNSGGDTTKIFPKVAITDSGSGKVLPALVKRRNDAAKLFSGGYNDLYILYLQNKKSINYATIGLIIIGLGAYVYYLKKKGVF